MIKFIRGRAYIFTLHYITYMTFLEMTSITSMVYQ